VRAVVLTHLTERLQAIEVSALCDADKALPVCDAAIRAMVPGVRMAGPALTVTAEDDHLPVFSALAEAAPGEVLVIATNGGRLAVLGELLATEARRRGLAGVVIAPAGQIEAALELAELIAAKGRALLAAMARGEALHDGTNHAQHVTALDAGEASALAFTIDVDAR